MRVFAVPMGIANANALLSAGRAFLREAPAGTEVVFDLIDVKDADSSSLTVIFAWLRTVRANGGSLRVVNAPVDMRKLVDVYDVSDYLPLA